jgi:tetratricopeptide (TPR) repeat protein
LQSAWNDLRNKDWDLAEQKADALLAMDADMGQVYFLKARLLWLREGIPAYLAQQESFIEKVTHDAAALARLYNLTGCALDAEQRYAEALPYFQKAALTSSDEPMYVANIAEIYYKLHQPKEALKHAQTAFAHGNQADIVKEIIANKGVKPE